MRYRGQCFRVMSSYYNLGAQLKGRSIRTNWAARKATPQSKYLHSYRRCTPFIKIFTWNFPTYLKFTSAGMKSVKCLFCHIAYFGSLDKIIIMSQITVRSYHLPLTLKQLYHGSLVNFVNIANQLHFLVPYET